MLIYYKSANVITIDNSNQESLSNVYCPYIDANYINFDGCYKQYIEYNCGIFLVYQDESNALLFKIKEEVTGKYGCRIIYSFFHKEEIPSDLKQDQLYHFYSQYIPKIVNNSCLL